MSLVRLSDPEPRTNAFADLAPNDQSLRASLLEPAVRQLEDDLRFAMRMVGQEADKTARGIDEAAARTALIADNCQTLARHSTLADSDFEAFELAATRQEIGWEEMRADIRELDRVAAETRELAARLSRQSRRINEAIQRVDALAASVSALASQTHVLSLNVALSAAHGRDEDPSQGALARSSKSLASAAAATARDMAGGIAALREAARGNEEIAEQTAGLAPRMEPRIGAIQEALRRQSRDLGDSRRQAREFARVARAAATRARDVETLARSAQSSVKQAKRAGEGLLLALGRHSQRASALIRNGTWGDRRDSRRAPVKTPCSFPLFGERRQALVLDISLGGALLLPEPQCPNPTAPVPLSIEGLGECWASVVGLGDPGWHIKFESPCAAFLEATRALMNQSMRSDAAMIAKVRRSAGLVARAFEEGVARGCVRIDDLITTAYRPIPGALPAQYETDATDFYERTLAPILREHWLAFPAPVYAVAADRNAYIPVHHPALSHPPRSEDPAWNDANCRNKRILDSWPILIASRNTDPISRKVSLKRMPHGAWEPLKTLSSPIFVEGRLWGNLHVGQLF